MTHLKRILLFLSMVWSFNTTYSQCGANVPYFYTNLTGNPDSVWLSPSVVRVDNCCASTPPDNCLAIDILLDPGAVGIIFDIYSGAVPPGALYYQIGCGPLHQVGTAICLNGPGPHHLTFCKPGNNQNVYSVTSVRGPIASNDIDVYYQCNAFLFASGFSNPSLQWNSIAPGGFGTYNSYLDCNSGCDTVHVLQPQTLPPYIDFQVCGIPTAICGSVNVCDTVRVTYHPTLHADVTPPIALLCYEDSTIQLTANVLNGVPPYVYLWSTGATTPSIAAGAGTFSVQVLDQRSCDYALDSATITKISVPVRAYCTGDFDTCGTVNTISLTGSITGAPGGVWSGGTGVFSPNNSSLNVTYNVTNTDRANGFVDFVLHPVQTTTNCPFHDDTIRVTLTTFSGAVSPTINNIPCYGLSNGSIQLNVTQGAPPYSFLWNTGSAFSNIQNLPPGPYSVNITDVNQCRQSFNYVVTQPTLLAMSGSASPVICNGGSTGSIVIAPVGGTPGYTYQWSNGALTQNISGLIAGVYSVSVRDANLCSVIASYTVTQPGLLQISSSTIQAVGCYGGNNGNILINPTGGISPYTFQWSNGNTSQNIGSVSAATYTVTVLDVNLCSVTSSFAVTQPSALVLNSATIQNVTCFGTNNGSILLNPSGGSFPYTYQWSNGATTINTGNLTAGSYNVTVTDQNACTVSAVYLITAPAQIVLNSSVVQHVSCYSGNDGGISISVTGGTLPYNYQWSNAASTASNSSIPAGNYSVIVYDQNFCSVSAGYVITQPTQMQITSSTIQAISCNGAADGSIIINTTGGVPPYNFQWSNGSSSQNPGGLSAGSYSVTVLDQHLCSVTANFIVSQPAQLVLNPATIQNITCFGSNNGSILLHPAGGTFPFTYQWNNGASTVNIGNLTTGTYSVTTTDQHGCTTAGIYLISEPGQLVINPATIQNVNCYNGNDGSINVNVTGGTFPYIYQWSNGSVSNFNNNLYAGTYNLLVYDQNLCSATANYNISQPTQVILNPPGLLNPTCYGSSSGGIAANPAGGTAPYYCNWSNGGTSQAMSNLPGGNYSLTVTDQHLCSVTAIYIISQPTQMQFNAFIQNENCFGASNASITLNPYGGTPGYTFQWSTGATSISINNLLPGTYSITMTDQNSCSVSTSFIVSEPVLLVLNAPTFQNSTCFNSGNGSITANAFGGTTPYSYQWSNGNTTQTVSSLAGGIYNVTVYDQHICSASASYTITEPTQLSVNTSATIIQNTSCYNGNDGTISISATGGLTPYVYQWSNGSVSQNIANVFAGTYTVTIIDNGQCTTSASFNVLEPAQIVFNTPITGNVHCYSGSDGSIAVNVSGGTPLYTYQWSTGAVTSAINQLQAGAYAVTVVDQNQCTASAVFTVYQPQQVQVNATPVSETCVGASNGTIQASATGGTPSYNYTLLLNSSLVQSNTTGLFTLLAPATYQVMAADNYGCLDTTQTILQLAIPDNYSVQLDTIPCAGDNSGGIFVGSTVIQNAPHTFTLNNGTSNNSGVFTNLQPGVYTVTVSNVYGCDTSFTVNLAEPPDAFLEIVPHLDTINLGESMQFRFIFGPYDTSAIVSYDWEPHEGLNCYDCPNPIPKNYQLRNDYNLTVQYNNGCVVKAWAVIYVNSEYTVYIPNAFTPDGDGRDDVFRIYGNKGTWKQMDFMIFNRIGEKVFESTDINFEWDGTYKGKPQFPAVFVYYAKIRFLDEHDEKFKGSITLIK